MTISQALKTLEINEHVNVDIVKRAYRKLMKENHPDLGGSAAKAAQINEAYELLLENVGKDITSSYDMRCTGYCHVRHMVNYTVNCDDIVKEEIKDVNGVDVLSNIKDNDIITINAQIKVGDFILKDEWHTSYKGYNTEFIKTYNLGESLGLKLEGEKIKVRIGEIKELDIQNVKGKVYVISISNRLCKIKLRFVVE